jgi:hypothetical protein
MKIMHVLFTFQTAIFARSKRRPKVATCSWQKKIKPLQKMVSRGIPIVNMWGNA